MMMMMERKYEMDYIGNKIKLKGCVKSGTWIACIDCAFSKALCQKNRGEIVWKEFGEMNDGT